MTPEPVPLPPESRASRAAPPHALDIPSSQSLLPPALRWLGPPLAAIYGCGMRMHRALTTPRWAPLPTLVIGNITVGGTGKTPMACYVAGRLAREGRKPAVLMRGYKGQGSDEAREVEASLNASNKTGCETDASQADLAEVPGARAVPVIVGADRLASAAIAKERGCSVALLDDGFQHWRLKRDFDIVLVDASAPFGGGHLAPWGRLREAPEEALRRAGSLVVTRADAIPPAALDALLELLRSIAPGVPLSAARHAPQALVDIRAGRREVPLERLREGAFAGVCGIGHPAAFAQTLRELGTQLVHFRALPDHAAYTPDLWRGVVAQASAAGATAIVTTEKDAVKLAALPQTGDIGVYALSIRLEFMFGETELWNAVSAALERAAARLAEP